MQYFNFLPSFQYHTIKQVDGSTTHCECSIVQKLISGHLMTSCIHTGPVGCPWCIKGCRTNRSSPCTVWPIFSCACCFQVHSCQESQWWRCNESNKDTLSDRHEAPTLVIELNKWSVWVFVVQWVFWLTTGVSCSWMNNFYIHELLCIFFLEK